MVLEGTDYFCKSHSDLSLCLWLLDHTTTTVGSSSTSTSIAPLLIGFFAGISVILVVGIIVYFCFCRAKKAPVQGMDGVVVDKKSKKETSTGSTTGTTKSGMKKTVSKY
uniref:Synaptotagmin n=1 Tax=Caenorhabditis tropicalis TaxID=1561998 RepID=A0A1I7UTP0_9PELO